jgi:hypothetical protein
MRRLAMPHMVRCLSAQPVTHGPQFHFFGYYDKPPWDASGRYLVGLETEFMDRPPTPRDAATIGLIDTARENAWRPLARTFAWNWQQGTMLHWLPAAADRLVCYNVRPGAQPRRLGARFGAVILNVVTGEERLLPRPIYALSPDGRSALSTNFSRLADMRPGYGYVGLEDPGRDDPAPADDGIYRMDLQTGEHELIISYAQVAHHQRDASMERAKHWFNHLQVAPDGGRFAFLHRWVAWGTARPWRTRLFTADFDGSELFCLADHEMISHYDWRDPTHILAWARQYDIGDRYFLFTDRSRAPAKGAREVVGEGLFPTDGHCSYSPDRRWVLTDTYPDQERQRTLVLYRPEDDLRVDIGRFFAPPELGGEIRCDLHPRWSRDGRQVSFDSAHEGARQMYVVDVSPIVEAGSAEVGEGKVGHRKDSRAV